MSTEFESKSISEQKSELFSKLVRELLDKGISKSEICTALDINKQYFSFLIRHNGNITDKMIDDLVKAYEIEPPVLIAADEYVTLNEKVKNTGAEIGAVSESIIKTLMSRIETLSAENGILKYQLEAAGQPTD